MKIPELYTVRIIKKQEAYPWIFFRHYAHRVPSISYAMGLFSNQELKGICTFGIPASRFLCEGICGKEYVDQVIELNRLVIEENQNKNTASYFVGNSLKLLPLETIVVSYADTKMSHIGYVYQACNFIYTGLSKKHIDYVEDGSEGRHQRHTSIKKSDPRAIGIERSRKHRYVFLIGNKTWKKMMKKNIKYPILAYPKGDNKRYDASGYIEKQKHLF